MLNNITHQTPHYQYFHKGNTQDAVGQTQGGFALVGGSKDIDEVFQWMADRGDGGDFLVLRGSGSDGYQDYIGEVAHTNSVQTLVIKDKEAASDPFVLDKVAKAEAIFLAGGDQWNYVGKWKDTPLLNCLNQAIEKGVPIGGTSAGLAVLGEHVYSAETGSVTSSEALADPFTESITLESHFLEAKPLQDLVTDTHFSERERMGRLVTFMARVQHDQKLDTVRGVGVDEQTAVLVDPDGQSRTIGKGRAHFVIATGPPEKMTPAKALTHKHLMETVVHSGQRFDFASWTSPQTEPRPLYVLDGKLFER